MGSDVKIDGMGCAVDSWLWLGSLDGAVVADGVQDAHVWSMVSSQLRAVDGGEVYVRRESADGGVDGIAVERDGCGIL